MSDYFRNSESVIITLKYNDASGSEERVISHKMKLFLDYESLKSLM